MSSSLSSSSSSSRAHLARACNCREKREKELNQLDIFWFSTRPFFIRKLKNGKKGVPLSLFALHKKTRKTKQTLFKTQKKNGLSRSRTKEKVGSGAVGGGEIETTEPALVRAIVRHGVLREPRWEKGKERGEEEQ